MGLKLGGPCEALCGVAGKRAGKLTRWVAPGEELQKPDSGAPAIPAVLRSLLSPRRGSRLQPGCQPAQLRLPLPASGEKSLRLTASAAPSVCVAAGEAAAPSLLPPPPGQLGRSRAPLPSLARRPLPTATVASRWDGARLPLPGEGQGQAGVHRCSCSPALSWCSCRPQPSFPQILAHHSGFQSSISQ